jgi:hypothetical protein
LLILFEAGNFMWIVAVGWIYVVGLMALTEASVIAGIMTFIMYCILPLSLVYYIVGRRRAPLANAAPPAAPAASESIDQPPPG